MKGGTTRPKRRVMNVSLDERMFARLMMLCERDGLMVSEVVRQAIHEFLKKEEGR